MENRMNEGVIDTRNIESMTDKQVTELATNTLKESTNKQNPNITSDKEIIESLNIPFEMYDNYMLIKPLKPQNIKKRVEVLDEKKNKGKMSQEIMETKRVTKSVQTDYREGIVLAAGPNAYFPNYHNNNEKSMIEIGDKVVFNKSVIDRSWFDLFKDSLLLRNYDLVARSHSV